MPSSSPARHRCRDSKNAESHTQYRVELKACRFSWITVRTNLLFCEGAQRLLRVPLRDRFPFGGNVSCTWVHQLQLSSNHFASFCN